MEIHASNLRPRRRDVLAYGAGLALVPSVSWAGRPSSDDLAVGFCPETPGSQKAETEATAVVAARRLPAGEARLARRGVRVTVHGLVGDLDRWPSLGIRTAELKVGFPVREDRIEFLAWSHQLLPVENAGTANVFTVPVDRGLALALELETLGTERYEAVLETGSESDVPKLRAGRYLIAPGTAELLPRRFDPVASKPLIALSVEPI